jgi:hypothetical protein
MTDEILFRRGTTLVRRLCLAPGEAMPWHRDPYHRVSVVLSGNELAIEDRGTGEIDHFPVGPGQVDWDEPSDRIRGINTGARRYEEITVFFLDEPDAVPQPTE